MSKSDINQVLKAIPKIQLKTLDDFSGINGVYSLNNTSLFLDFVYLKRRIEEGGRRLIVFFCGAVDRKKLELPVFQRWKWSEDLEFDLLYISDPTLHLDREMKIGWYFGTAERNATELCAHVISAIANKLSISRKSIVLYGSSAGGFAAFQCARFLPGSRVVAINPQTDIRKYHLSHVRIFEKNCLAGIPVSGSRLSWFLDLNQIEDTKFLVFQNFSDRFHIENHFKPFLEFVERDGKLKKNFCFETFDDPEGGHDSAEGRSRCKDLIARVFDL